MRISKQKLKQIIIEEVRRALSEQSVPADPTQALIEKYWGVAAGQKIEIPTEDLLKLKKIAKKNANAAKILALFYKPRQRTQYSYWRKHYEKLSDTDLGRSAGRVAKAITPSKVFYGPANIMMKMERDFREATGIRGVMDPSGWQDADGKVVVRPFHEWPKWAKKYPTLYAIAQSASNVTLGDPAAMLAMLVAGGITDKALARGVPALQRLPGLNNSALRAAIDSRLTSAANRMVSRYGTHARGVGETGADALETITDVIWGWVPTY